MADEGKKSPHVEHGSTPEGPLSKSLRDQMTIEMGVIHKND